jgi:hypothetical protein
MRTLLASILVSSTLAFQAIAAVATVDDARPSAASLRARHADLAERLAASPFGKPLYLDASEDRQRVNGDAYAVLDHAFARASAALSDPAQWCEIMLLPFNTKQCVSSSASLDAQALAISVGRKYNTPLDSTQRLEFRFARPIRAPDFLHVELTASSGPFGTRDYRIVLEMVPLDERRSFMRFGYSYAYGMLARAAMQAYLSTVGASKVGFTQEEGGLVRGMRGVMERNTMRYLLAIESYLRVQSVPERERATRMVEDWFAAVERYPRQLHELTREEYVPMKLAEYERLHAGGSPPRGQDPMVSRGPRTASSSPSPS